MFDINNPNHRLNCVKICMQGHENSEITCINFHENLLLSGSENGIVVLWNLYNNQVVKTPHYIQSSILKSEFVNEKCFLVISSEFKIYIFQKVLKTHGNAEITSVEFRCFTMLDLGVPRKADVLESSCLCGKELWLGTQKGRLFVVDMVKVCQEFGLNVQDYFSHTGGSKKTPS